MNDVTAAQQIQSTGMIRVFNSRLSEKPPKKPDICEVQEMVYVVNTPWQGHLVDVTVDHPWKFS